eukprot:scaffold2860_cov106-Isochrysis_galbana.AAC.2
MRIRQPPENEAVGAPFCSSRNWRPERMAEARWSAESAPMSASSSYTSDNLPATAPSSSKHRHLAAIVLAPGARHKRAALQLGLFDVPHPTLLQLVWRDLVGLVQRHLVHVRQPLERPRFLQQGRPARVGQNNHLERADLVRRCHLLLHQQDVRIGRDRLGNVLIRAVANRVHQRRLAAAVGADEAVPPTMHQREARILEQCLTAHADRELGADNVIAALHRPPGRGSAVAGARACRPALFFLCVSGTRIIMRLTIAWELSVGLV